MLTQSAMSTGIRRKTPRMDDHRGSEQPPGGGLAAAEPGGATAVEAFDRGRCFMAT
jgi:hypothetical protein